MPSEFSSQMPLWLPVLAKICNAHGALQQGVVRHVLAARHHAQHLRLQRVILHAVPLFHLGRGLAQHIGRIDIHQHKPAQRKHACQQKQHSARQPLRKFQRLASSFSSL